MKILNSGDKMNENKWKGVLVVLALFLSAASYNATLFCAGISNIAHLYYPPFIGNLQVMPLSLTYIGAFAFENHQSIIDNIFLMGVYC
jgi:hypothetical protein